MISANHIVYLPLPKLNQAGQLKSSRTRPKPDLPIFPKIARQLVTFLPWTLSVRNFQGPIISLSLLVYLSLPPCISPLLVVKSHGLEHSSPSFGPTTGLVFLLIYKPSGVCLSKSLLSGRGRCLRIITMSFTGTLDKCKACDKTVYVVDLLSADGVSYHKSCFKCSHCKGTLVVCETTWTCMVSGLWKNWNVILNPPRDRYEPSYIASFV